MSASSSGNDILVCTICFYRRETTRRRCDTCINTKICAICHNTILNNNRLPKCPTCRQTYPSILYEDPPERSCRQLLDFYKRLLFYGSFLVILLVLILVIIISIIYFPYNCKLEPLKRKKYDCSDNFDNAAQCVTQKVDETNYYLGCKIQVNFDKRTIFENKLQSNTTDYYFNYITKEITPYLDNIFTDDYREIYLWEEEKHIYNCAECFVDPNNKDNYDIRLCSLTNDAYSRPTICYKNSKDCIRTYSSPNKWITFLVLCILSMSVSAIIYIIFLFIGTIIYVEGLMVGYLNENEVLTSMIIVFGGGCGFMLFLAGILIIPLYIVSHYTC
jgi:hypothetical protein